MTDLKKYQMYIDGQWVNSESEKTFESFNPATEEPWANDSTEQEPAQTKHTAAEDQNGQPLA